MCIRDRVKAFGRSEPVKEFHNSELLRLVHGGADAPDAAVAIVGVSLLVVNELVHRDIHVVLAALAVLRGIPEAVLPVVPEEVNSLLLHLAVADGRPVLSRGVRIHNCLLYTSRCV